MDQFYLTRMSFLILPADDGRPQALPLGAKLTAEDQISCVYLSASPREAVLVRCLLAKFNITVRRAAGLDEALLLVKVMGAKVLLVDYRFAKGTWRDAIREASEQRPEVAVIVAVPTRLASVWEDIIPAGGYEVVLKPFMLAELGPVLRNADRYAREFLTDAAREAREKAVIEAIRSLAKENEQHSPRNPGVAECEGVKPNGSFARKAFGLYLGARAYLRRIFHWGGKL